MIINRLQDQKFEKPVRYLNDRCGFYVNSSMYITNVSKRKKSLDILYYDEINNI